jgi:signal transduction histidine kinase
VALTRIDRVFEEVAGKVIPPEMLDCGRTRALLTLDDPESDARADGAACLAYAKRRFGAIAAHLADDQASLRALIEEVAEVSGIPRVVLARELARLPELLELPPSEALQLELALVLAGADLYATSLWTIWSGGDLRHIAHAGAFDPDALETRQLARALLAGRSDGSDHACGDVAGVLIERPHRPAAALIARGPRAASAERLSLLEAAVAMLRALLERAELLSRENGTEQAMLAATERRLARVRFDLHDGPQQDLILLGEDLALFRGQLKSAMDGHRHRDQLLGRLEDLQARLVALDGDLRRISVSVQSPFLQAEPLPDALAQLVDDFASRTGIQPETQLRGDLSDLTDSQQIALLGLIREALSNIREHSDARRVRISLTANANAVEATVTDDGRGFDPEETLVRAAREGHLGLVGMHERVRLLGGRTRIDSRPGGPTVISISLPSPDSVMPDPARAASRKKRP